jgi:hypothetical protein
MLRIPVLALAIMFAATACEKRPRQRPLPAETGITGGELIFEEDFANGLDNWEVASKNWRIVDGRLFTGDHPNQNKGAWLKGVTLPENVRMEFEATSVQGNKPQFEGDMKFEFGGDRPEHAAGYIIIFGGWKNSINTIARHDEHGEGRLVVDSTRKVKEDQTYHFKVIRLNGEVKWFLGKSLVLRVKDSAPALGGAFGFNDWDSRVYFDNLKIYAL